MRQWVRIAVVVLIVLSGVAAPALAQPEVGNGEDTGPDSGPDIPEEGDVESGDSDGERGTESESESESESGGDDDTGNGSGLGGGGGILGGGSVLPSADDWLEEASDWFRGDLQDGLVAYVDSLNTVFVGIAAPGEPTSPSTWVMPQNGMWDVAAEFYVAAASMASVLWAAGFVYLFDIESRQKQREVLRTLIYSALATVTGMVLLGLYFNATNIFVRAIAPDGTEFVANTGGLIQLGIGHVIAVILIVVNAGVVVLGGIIMFGIYLLPLILFAFFPFIVASKAVPVKPLQSTANLGLTTLALLPLLRIIQALLLRLAKMLTWEATGLGEQVASLLGTAIILTIALLVLPYIFYKNIETASGMALSTITVKKANQGASKVNDAATWTGSRAKNRAKSAAAPHVNRARSAASQKASNAKFRAGSRIGGAMLTAKFGRPGHTTPAQAARENRSKKSGGTLSSSSPSGSTSTSKMPDQPTSPTSRAASRQRAINRQRRDAIKRRRATRSDD